MPMVWNAEADAKLFAAVLKIHEIKVNYAALAAEMGSDCTAKAITHRIQKIKNQSKAAGSAPTTPAATSKRARPPAAPKTPKTPHGDATPSKARSARKTAKPTSYAKSDDDEGGAYESPKEKMEEELEESPKKKMKQEVTNEEDEGV